MLDLRTTRYNNSDTRESLWDEDYKKAYPTIMSDTVIAYAEAVREDRCLPNFQPLLYIKNEEYKKLMDEHAQELLDALRKKMEPLPFNERIEAILYYGRLKRKIFGKSDNFLSGSDDEPMRERTHERDENDDINR